MIQLIGISCLQASTWLAALDIPSAARLTHLAATLSQTVQRCAARTLPAVLQLSELLISGAKLSGVAVQQLVYKSAGTEVGVQWVNAPCGASARLALAGVALLEQVRCVWYRLQCLACVLRVERLFRGVFWGFVQDAGGEMGVQWVNAPCGASARVFLPLNRCIFGIDYNVWRYVAF